MKRTDRPISVDTAKPAVARAAVAAGARLWNDVTALRWADDSLATAAELGCDALMEGSSGRGNDQYRMHNVFSVFAPALKILVPVRDFDLTRQEELALCEHYGVPELGRSLLGKYALPFELAGVLLLVVMIGAAYMAKGRQADLTKGQGQ